jgi:hypothetical protein
MDRCVNLRDELYDDFRWVEAFLVLLNPSVPRV